VPFRDILNGVNVRIEPGGRVAESLQIDGVGLVEISYERCPVGWTARFSMTTPLVADLGIVHRLVAPSLREARRAVPAAAAFLAGNPADLPVPLT
jgi:hypothetical protein